MKNFKLLTTVLLAGLLTVNTFAQTLSTDAVVVAKQQAIIEKATLSQTKDTTSRISIHLTCLDQFNNLLSVREKNGGWQGVSATYSSSISKEVKVNQVLERENYKTYKLDFRTKYIKGVEHYCTTATLIPAKIVNTIMGTVKVPDNISTENLYIQLVDTNGKTNAYLKIQEDKTYKCYNIPNGKYSLSVVSGEISNNLHGPSKFLVDRRFYEENISINGNYNKNITINNTDSSMDSIYAQASVQKNLNVKDFFNTIDYEEAKTFVKTNELLKLTDKAKEDIKSKVKEGSSDIQTIKNIMVYIQNNYHNPPKADTDGETITSVVEIYNRQYADDCSEYSELFEAICALYEIPTVQLHGMSEKIARARADGNTEWIGGHIFVEAYVADQDKWVLVDPTACFLTVDYNKDCPIIRADSSSRKDDYMYVIRKNINGTTYYSENGELRWAEFDGLVSITDNFDFSLFDYSNCNYSTIAQSVK